MVSPDFVNFTYRYRVIPVMVILTVRFDKTALKVEMQRREINDAGFCFRENRKLCR